jgi:hypothetical protein
MRGDSLAAGTTGILTYTLFQRRIKGRIFNDRFRR